MRNSGYCRPSSPATRPRYIKKYPEGVRHTQPQVGRDPEGARRPRSRPTWGKGSKSHSALKGLDSMPLFTNRLLQHARFQEEGRGLPTGSVPHRGRLPLGPKAAPCRSPVRRRPGRAPEGWVSRHHRTERRRCVPMPDCTAIGDAEWFHSTDAQKGRTFSAQGLIVVPVPRASPGASALCGLRPRLFIVKKLQDKNPESIDPLVATKHLSQLRKLCLELLETQTQNRPIRPGSRN